MPSLSYLACFTLTLTLALLAGCDEEAESVPDDAATPDAAARDASFADANNNRLADSGAPLDAGGNRDAGGEPDVGLPSDGGTPLDSAPVDSGSIADPCTTLFERLLTSVSDACEGHEECTYCRCAVEGLSHDPSRDACCGAEEYYDGVGCRAVDTACRPDTALECLEDPACLGEYDEFWPIAIREFCR